MLLLIPPTNVAPGGDSGETALDVEWAHAIAPEASIICVEADSFDIGYPGITPATSDYATAVRTAADYPGVSVVSMSFGTPEFATEHNWDSVFTTPPGHPNVTFLAASGDSKTSAQDNGTYPAFSPNVVAVGGTTLSLNSDNSYKGEVAWNQSPATGDRQLGRHQPLRARAALPAGRQFHRLADHPRRLLARCHQPHEPRHGDSRRVLQPSRIICERPGFGGVAAYDSYQNGKATDANFWVLNGGTSLSSPAFAGLIAIGDQLRQSVGEAPLDTSQTLNTLYSLPASAFHDITVGNNLVPYYAGPGYDLVTGRGSPVANLLVPALVGPYLASLQRVGIHHQPKSLDLTFIGPLDPGPAQDLGNYTLLAQGPHGSFFHKTSPAFSDLQRGEPDGGARAAGAAEPASYVRAAGQRHAAGGVGDPARHPPGRRQPDGDLPWVGPASPVA